MSTIPLSSIDPKPEAEKVAEFTHTPPPGSTNEEALERVVSDALKQHPG
jgi:hypothetical protein